jgi:hypothetical protein
MAKGCSVMTCSIAARGIDLRQRSADDGACLPQPQAEVDLDLGKTAGTTAILPDVLNSHVEVY